MLGHTSMTTKNNMEMIKIFDIKKPKDRRKMNWAEAKWANPRLKPMGDWDNDGVKNKYDCKPMNRKKQHDPSSKWKIRMEREFATVGSLRDFADGEKE